MSNGKIAGSGLAPRIRSDVEIPAWESEGDSVETKRVDARYDPESSRARKRLHGRRLIEMFSDLVGIAAGPDLEPTGLGTLG